MYANIIKAMDEILSVWNPGSILLLEHVSVQTSYAPVAHICCTGECAWMAGQQHRPQGSQCQGASGIWQLPERMSERARESTCGESKTSRGWAGPEVPVWSVPHPRAPGPGGLLGGCRGGPVQSAHSQGVVPAPSLTHPCQLWERWTDCSQDPSCGAGQSWSQQLDSPAHVDGGRRQGWYPHSQAPLWLSSIIPAPLCSPYSWCVIPSTCPFGLSLTQQHQSPFPGAVCRAVVETDALSLSRRNHSVTY